MTQSDTTTSPLEDAISHLYTTGHADLAAAVQYAADHQAPTDSEALVTKLTADVVLFADNPRGDLCTLMIRRGWDPFKGLWALPGGHVDAGEETLDAAYRELAEETGIRIGPCLQLVGVYAAPGRDPRGRYATFAYAARLGRMPEPTAGDDAEEACWVPVEELLHGGTPLAFDHEQILRDALNTVY
jgi:8-oxo-dGTP diphosphatase